jgi:hypothetical protein
MNIAVLTVVLVATALLGGWVGYRVAMVQLGNEVRQMRKELAALKELKERPYRNGSLN